MYACMQMCGRRAFFCGLSSVIPSDLGRKGDVHFLAGGFLYIILSVYAYGRRGMYGVWLGVCI